MVFVIGMLGRGAGRRRNMGIIAVDIGSERGRNDAGGDGLACETVGEVAAVADSRFSFVDDRHLGGDSIRLVWPRPLFARTLQIWKTFGARAVGRHAKALL